ncbi:Peptidoglycan-recognition protein LB [Eumeta japonica]|uniref:Peptidoglycan-recognition protein n=1 Tax=Eumeta variegata TaxID=151549 RepID=A0A4C1UME5_EUMVA|nr:Peptidoglycan-recognition protein LB [Eumeta japonica]
MGKKILLCCFLSAVICEVPAMPGTVKKESSYNFPFVPRSEWSIRPPMDDPTPLDTPVPYVVIHHTYIPGACADKETCTLSMRSMQRAHMALDWGDIGYNFCVGGDGVAYEGRGWRVLGVHAGRANRFSLGICLIGDWRFELPPTQQLKTVEALIATALDLGIIDEHYKLVGHRQMTDTECPGDALLEEIKTWKNYSPLPAGPEDPL